VAANGSSSTRNSRHVRGSFQEELEKLVPGDPDRPNDSPYELGGLVIARDIRRGKRVARLIEIGMVFINRATWTAPDLPSGE
jgi:hypothetical protein